MSVEYFVNLMAQQAIQMAEKLDKAFANLGEVAKKMGGSVDGAEAAIASLGGTMGGVASKVDAAAKAMGGFADANSRAAQASAAYERQQSASADRIAKKAQTMWETSEARKQSGVPERGGKSGLGAMGGLFALSMLHNDNFKTWEDFDDQFRKISGTLGGKLSDSELGALRKSAIDTAKGTRFAPVDIAKIMLAEASQGVPLNQVDPKTGQLLGGVIAKQMLGIATGTGEDPAETFSTHLKIQRGFKLGFDAFPHISDTIALLHNQTGASMKQIQTQMGNIAAAAGASGWTEEQTAGALGVLTKHGVGQMAGVGLRRVIEQSTKNWSKTQQAGWDSLHINQGMLKDPKTGGVITPVNLAKLLEEHTKGMPAFDVEKAMSQIFGSKAATVGTQLLGSSKEMEDLTYMLEHVEGLANKMEEFGAKGGAAGVAQMAASWKDLQTQIGETGFGDQVGDLARKFASLFDTISGGPTWAKEATGWAALSMNMLSDAAMPLMAVSALIPIAKSASGLFTSLSGIKSLGAIGVGLMVADVVWQNWDKIAAASERVGAAISKIRGGDIAGGAADLWNAAKDINKKLGDAAGPLPGTPAAFGWSAGVHPHGHGSRFYQPTGIDHLAAILPHFADTQGRMSHAKDIIAKAEQAIRVSVDVNVKPVSPVTVNVTGQVNSPLQGSGTIPMSASASRGAATAEGSYGHVR